MSEKARVDFVFFDAGGGHRSAAVALRSVIQRDGRPWDVRLTNLQEVLDDVDIFRKLSGIRAQDIYNQALRKGWTLGSAEIIPAMHAVFRLYQPAMLPILKRYFRDSRPDLVVSLIPNFNRVLFRSLRAVQPETPYVTILTDFADFPPHFWMERQDQFLICGTDRAVEQAIGLGYPPHRVLRTSGMILRPDFYERPVIDPREGRKQLGLHPGLPTGLVLFGGQGSAAMYRIARRVREMTTPAQFLFLCGRNARVAAQIRRLESPWPCHVEEFTTQIPYYMHLADFFLGKPGPGSVSEALQSRLPVIVERNRFTLAQERYNAEWVRENGYGITVRGWRNIAQTLSGLIDLGGLDRMRARLQTYNNQAVFEIPRYLDRILAGDPAPRLETAAA